MSGRPPSAEEKFYIDWGLETVKKNLDLANGILHQLLTVNVALLGGSVLFLSSELSVGFARWTAMALFLVALIIAFFGILPYERQVDLRSPEDIKNHKSAALRHKRYFIYSSALFTVLAFSVAISGLALKQVRG